MAREYYLISKNLGQSFVKYKGNTIRLSEQIPYTVDEILVGIKGQIGKERKITTFKDSQGNIIERAFDYFDKPLRNQVYSRNDYINSDELFTTSTTIKEYQIKRNILKIYKDYKDDFQQLGIRTTLWQKTKILTNHLCENIQTGEKILSQTSITNIKQPKRQIHSFIEFPHILDGKRQNDNKKILQVWVNSKTGFADETITEQGVKRPKKDSFLAFRALDITELKEAITTFFIKKCKLTPAQISVSTNYTPSGTDNEKLSAIFLSADGSINFNKYFKFISKPKLVSTARHEVEHAWQFLLHARNTGGQCDWQMLMAKKFGTIRNKRLQKEAQRYTKSIKNYIPHDVDFEKYKKNYIEIKANKAGQQERTRYEKQAQEISESFPFIPKEML